jgi:cytochrome c553
MRLDLPLNLSQIANMRAFSEDISMVARTFSILLLSQALVFSETKEEASKSPGASLFTEKCAACHGNKAQGDLKQQTPALASLPVWYLTRQIGKFQNNIRGAKPEDLDGLKMRAIAHTLKPDQLQVLTTHIRSLPRVQSLFTLKENVEKGRELFRENCMACHRYNGTGELVFGSPPLTGLQDWYILKQLQKFKKGIRGNHEKDKEGQKMHSLAKTLTEEELRNIATFLPHLAKEHEKDRNKE